MIKRLTLACSMLVLAAGCGSGEGADTARSIAEDWEIVQHSGF